MALGTDISFPQTPALDKSAMLAQQNLASLGVQAHPMLGTQTPSADHTPDSTSHHNNSYMVGSSWHTYANLSQDQQHQADRMAQQDSQYAVGGVEPPHLTQNPVAMLERQPEVTSPGPLGLGSGSGIASSQVQAPSLGSDAGVQAPAQNADPMTVAQQQFTGAGGKFDVSCLVNPPVAFELSPSATPQMDIPGRGVPGMGGSGIA